MKDKKDDPSTKDFKIMPKEEVSKKIKETSKAAKAGGKEAWGNIKEMLQYSDQEEIEIMRSTRMFLYAMVIACVASIVWMSLSKLDVVSVAEGEVTPRSEVKSIQHFEGGIVKEIRVKEGDTVKKDQTLVILESTASGASVTELATRIASLKAEVARLRAEVQMSDADGTDVIKPQYPKGLQEQYPEIVEQSQNLFKVRQEGYRTEIRSAKEKIIQRKQDVIEVEARLDNLADRFDIAEEQVAISEDLLRDELTNRYNHLELLREVSVIKSSIEEDEAALIRTEAQLDEMRATFDGIRHSYVEEISTQVEEASAQLAEAEERMLKLADSLLRTVLTAPEDGVVQTMYAHTVGGVVKPGETVIDIVPAGDQLIIEARLPVQDVGYVANGQLATIRLSSADAMRFDKLDGNVIYIAADTTLDEATGEYFYKVRIETAATQFSGSGSMNYQLYPGMQVVSNIVIGRRSTLEYILSPFLESSFGAMQER